jgi:hypothetical protein
MPGLSSQTAAVPEGRARLLWLLRYRYFQMVFQINQMKGDVED